MSANARQVSRAVAILFLSLLALVECACTIPFHRREKRLCARAAWLHRWCRVACKLLGLRLRTDGSVPHAGLLVSNHLSYLDIIAFSALQPCVFVAKREVARWPLFGWLARSAGTIFVERARIRDCPRAAQEIRAALRANILVVLFPEGTSSDGSSVLPFKSALLAAERGSDAAIAAAALSYSAEGSVADEVCYWGDMTLLPHLVNLCAKRELQAFVRFGRQQSFAGNRKIIAAQLHSEVASLLKSR